MRLCQMILFGLAFATLVATIPVAARAQLTTSAQADTVRLDPAKLYDQPTG